MWSENSQQSQCSQQYHKQTIDNLIQTDSSTKIQTSQEFPRKMSIRSQPQFPSIQNFHQQSKLSQRKDMKQSLTFLDEIMDMKKKIKNNEIEVSPDLAAVVVEKYLLPMFEMENRQVTDGKRNQLLGKSENISLKGKKLNQETSKEELTQDQQQILGNKNFQLPQKKLQPLEGTVYSELRLSERLYKELQIVRQQLDDTVAKLKENIQNSACLQIQLDAQKTETLQCQINEKIMKNQLESQIKEVNIQKFSKEQILQSTQQYKNLYEESEKQRLILSDLLRQEKALNDKLQNKNIEHEHSNAILRMENDIVGERLRTLFSKLCFIIDKRCLEEKLYLELKNLFHSTQQFSTFLTSQKKNLLEVQTAKDHYIEEANQQAKQIQEIVANRDKIKIMAQTKLNELVKETTSLSNQNTTLTYQNNEFKQKNKSLGDELDKVRKKMHSLKQRYKRFGDQELKSCKHCQQEYSEYQNLNWSCRTHKSPWQGEIYWCCGKTNEKAPGCKTSKHESKDDEDELDQRDKDEIEKQQNRNVYCSNCKELGHRPTDCERDPNLRQERIISDELKRIESIQKQKRKQNKGLNNSLCRQRAIQQLQKKIQSQ